MWTIRRDAARRIVATFDGHLSAEDGPASCAAFVAELGADHADIVFDIRNMTGYDSEARRAWQTALWPRRSQVRSLVVVGGNAIVRMGASLLALALGVSATSAAELPS